MISLEQRYQGCLLGLAVGDAVGTTVEFMPPGSFPLVEDMVGGGPFGLNVGEWTDDTSMALCLADSLLACKGFDAGDQMDRYVRWWKEGYLSSNGRCFDIGGTVSQALRRYQQTGNPLSGSTDPHSAGNGSLMRLAPVPLFFANDPEKAIMMSGESSRTTHGVRACLDACRYFGGLLIGALEGESKDKLLSPRYSPVEGLWERIPLCFEIDEVARGSFEQKKPPQVVGSGDVVKALEAALWAFYRSSTFEEGCLLAVNLGNDADTTAAIYGQIAGAYYGINAIPARWIERLACKKEIVGIADQLYALSGGELYADENKQNDIGKK
jgi:ADP-ribosylglycohydrolase